MEDLNDALRSAALNGDLPLVKSLMARGADILAKDEVFCSALGRAAEEGHLPVVEYLVEHGNADYDDALVKAAGGGHLSVVEFLVARGADVRAGDDARSAPLCVAAYGGHLTVVDFLWQRDQTHADEALCQAAESGSLEVVKFLAARFDFRADGGRALMMAIGEDHLPVVACLVGMGETISADMLSEATTRGHVAIAEFLVAQRAHVAEQAVAPKSGKRRERDDEDRAGGGGKHGRK